MHRRILLTITCICILVGDFADAARASALTTADIQQDHQQNSQPVTEELRVVRITPQGDNVPAGQQIVIQFDRPVVAVGDMARDADDIPVTISPAVNCEWRWLESSALACQLSQHDKLQLASHYQVSVRSGLIAASGERLATSFTHNFTTQRPQVTYTRFITWSAPSAPLIQVTFDQPVQKTSVASALNFSSAANHYEMPVAVKVYEEPQQSPWFLQSSGQLSPSEHRLADSVNTNSDKNSNKIKSNTSNESRGQALNLTAAKRVWYVEPLSKLAQASKAQLNVTPGLVSAEGPLPGDENRPVVSFDTYPAFQFVGIQCTPKGGVKRQIIYHSDYLNRVQSEHSVADQHACAPLQPVGLIFTAPVLNSVVKRFAEISPGLDGSQTDFDPWANSQDWTSLGSPHRQGRYYTVWLPELLKAKADYQLSFDGGELVDEFGRQLGRDVSFAFSTSHREPRLSVRHRAAVLEQGVDSDVPVMVTNLNSVAVDYQRLTSQQRRHHISHSVVVPDARDIAFAHPLGVRDMVADASGAIFAQLTPDPLPPDFSKSQQLFAQVSPFQVHVKLGHFNSLVWVTRFADGKPVKDASVTLFKGTYQNLVELVGLSITRQTDASGQAQLPGTVTLDPLLQFTNSWGERPRLFVKVQLAEDMALLPLDSAFKISASGVYPWQQSKGRHGHSWGTTAQGIYRPGDTVEYKIYVREQSNHRWLAAPREGYTLTVKDPQNKTVYRLEDTELSEFGAMQGEFALPGQGAAGWYRFELEREDWLAGQQQTMQWTPMTVLVSDFTPAPFKVTAQLNGEHFRVGDTLGVDTAAVLHSGGPFAGAPVRVVASIDNLTFAPEQPKLKDYSFGRTDISARNQRHTLLDARAAMDQQGEYRHSRVIPGIDIYYGRLWLESAVQDDRGKNVAASTSATYAGRDRFTGLRHTRWVYEQGKTAQLEMLVSDDQGNIIPEVAVSISVQARAVKASRVKGPGNAYLTRNIAEWVEQHRCDLVSRDEPVACEFTPEKPGYYQFVARLRDTKGREQITSVDGWVSGSGHVLWGLDNDAALQIVPGQTQLQVGDTARYLVKNPYPGAQALISVERYGVIDSWVQTLDTSTPIIEVAVKEDYLPGFYLSVMVVSPRVGQPPGPGKVDLGKPAYRLGYVASRVQDQHQALKIKVSTDKPVYKPREMVTATVQVTLPAANSSAGKHSNQTRQAVELAVAVVDESVLALNRQGASYYDPYQGFNRLDALDLQNYSLLSRLVGRQKFAKKGANPGGDGGGYSAPIRDLFKYVSYWNPALMPDRHGKASFTFELPDNLTGWRLLVLGVTASDRMGLGQHNIKVNRPTELRPVMPNQVTAGDQFQAGFSLMNRTGKARDLVIEVNVSGALAVGSLKRHQQKVRLGAYRRQTLYFPVVTKGHGELQWLVSAGDKLDTDLIQHQINVNKRSSLEIAATYGTTEADKVTGDFAIPKGIVTDVGEVSAILFPSVIGNIDGAFRYLQHYPYWCWEQRLSKAVMASAYGQLKEYFTDSIHWDNAPQLVSDTLAAAADFQAPDGGMSYWVPKNQHVSPYLSAYTALALHWLRRDGHVIPLQTEARLHQYLQRLLKEDVFPAFYNKGMAASVRAVALAALAVAGKVDAAGVARYQPHFERMDLFGKAHFLQAAVLAGSDPELSKQALNSLLSHASQSGGKLQFREPWDSRYKYLLATPLRSDCGVLLSLLQARQHQAMSELVRDIPFKVVRSITQSRGRREHWENTQENVFCAHALIEYSRLYEAINPDFTATVTLDDEALGEASFKARSAPAETLSRPLNNSDPGTKRTMTISKDGPGRLYYSARLAYDLLQDDARRVNAGIEIRREISVERDGKFELLATPVTLSRGELARVDLFISVPTARHFVVVNDPVPGGLEPVNTQLATASAFDAEKSFSGAAQDGSFFAEGALFADGSLFAEGSYFYKVRDWTGYGQFFRSFYHRELKHDSARFFADYLPAGNYHLSYSAQAIAPGEFSILPVHAEEMYDPDIYGKGLPAKLIVKQTAANQ